MPDRIEPYHTSERAVFYNGDCRVVMAEMEENSVDSIVCDPPYEFGFMGRQWDSTGIAYDVRMWEQCLRVLKPGGHLLAFGGARTYHRMACAVEDAGFEIRDQIMWVYGSGFPKSMDVSKSIDKAARGVPQGGTDPTSPNHGQFKSGCSEDNPEGRGFGAGPGKFMKDGRSKYDGSNRKTAPSTSNGFGYDSKGEIKEFQPVSEDAQRWQGWGTALKPAHEPIVVARKPLIGTVAANVLEWGTGAINIDGCRIAGEPVPINRLENWSGFGQEKRPDYEQKMNSSGRWPANLIHDGSDEVLELFAKAGDRECGKSNGNAKVGDSSEGVITPLRRGTLVPRDDEGTAARFFFAAKDSEEDTKSPEEYAPNNKNNVYGEAMGGGWHPGFGDEGSASRFFYCAKADSTDRNEGLDDLEHKPAGEVTGGRIEGSDGLKSPRAGAGSPSGSKNHHPTVKPTSLMRYLCRLVTPPGGTVLDPFMGSGSTYKAAYQEGFNSIGIELEEPYCAISINRISQTVFNF